MNRNNSMSLRMKLVMAFGVVGTMPVMVITLIAFQQASVTQHEVAAVQEMAEKAPDNAIATQMGSRLDSVMAYQKRALTLIPLLAMLVLIIGLLTSVIVTRSIILPLIRIVNTLEQISNGNPDQRVEPVGNGEMVQLSQAINLALDSQRTAPLHEYHDEDCQTEEPMRSM